MPGTIPNPLWLYRIIHCDNIDFILKNGIYVRGHASHDPNYINIGNKDIISVRDNFKVKLDGYGNIGEYVPFYFGKQSIMLYNILTGHGVPKHNPQNIVYLCCEINDLTGTCKKYFFSDGQANKAFTEHYNDLKHLGEVDWDVVLGEDFTMNGDSDRPRRYMAEFLVHEFIPVDCIKKIIVFNQAKKQEVEKLVLDNGYKIPVRAIKEGYFFYF